MATVLVGASGWTYPPWRGHFYPRGLPHARELAHLASRLTAVEVNGTFYSLTRSSVCDAWHAAVPAQFTFAVKGSRRYVTHMLKLRGVGAPLANFFASGILRLGVQLGPILWQLPAMVRFDPCARRPSSRRCRPTSARTSGSRAATTGA